MARNDAHDDIPKSAWEVALNEKSALTVTRVASEVHKEEPVEFDNCHNENRRTNQEEVIVREVMFAVQDLATAELCTMIKDSLEDFQRTSFHNAQSCIRSVVDNVAGQVMMDLMRKDIPKDTIDAQI